MKLLAIVALAVVLGGCPHTKAAETTGQNTATPKDVVAAAKATIEKWRQAYEIRSIDALGKLYAHDVDLVVVLEGTPLLGWTAVETSLKDRLAHANEMHVRIKDVQVTSLAPSVASAVATLSREATGGTTTVTENGTVTLVLVEKPEGWVITSEHYSYKRP